ncbi:hypothetical protein ACAW74_09290 [Fibrella sp. WM1]|uniref:hypothetical protein n=1 Tax=Fibrella musci TaxID=3242485 RepID=UPI00352220F2
MHTRIYGLLIAAIAFTATLSCKKSEPAAVCTAPSADKNILGTWKASLPSSATATSNITFNTDGTFQESNSLLVPTTIYNVPVTKRTYAVQNNMLTLTLSGTSGSTNVNSTLSGSIDANECNKMEVSLGGVGGKVTLTR